MAATRDEFILCSSRVVTPQGERACGVLIRGGKIAALLARGDFPAGLPVEEEGNRVILPGLVDTHVHVNEPGRADWEGFATATRAAAAGGVTTIVDMPLNCRPVTTSARALEAKLEAARGQLYVDCGFWGGLVAGGAAAMPELARAGVLGVKAFLIDSGIEEFPPVKEPDLERAMPLLARAGLPLLAHAELALPGAPAAGGRAYRDYLASRPWQWECRAIDLLIRMCRATGCPTHVVHLSAAPALPALEAARRRGWPLTVETCPHYLLFQAGEIGNGATRLKCAPPIRGQENRERLWQGLGRGVIDMIASDHSPSPPRMKALDTGDFGQAWGGIASLGLGLGVLWGEARQRGFQPADLAHWMSARPALLAGLDGRKGALAPGCDADLVVWEPEGAFTLEKSMVYHRHSLTPYLGRRLEGRVVRTYLRGSLVFEEGRFPSPPRGEALLGRREREKR